VAAVTVPRVGCTAPEGETDRTADSAAHEKGDGQRQQSDDATEDQEKQEPVLTDGPSPELRVTQPLGVEVGVAVP
jgi:hypothetical protein